VELNATNNILVRSYLWGLDLSGNAEGAGLPRQSNATAGGVGGLLAVTIHASPSTTHFACYDGNGNVVALVDGRDGTASARYEYGPFAEPIRASGAIAAANPHRFSTKHQDDETELYYYGYRYLGNGRWLNRDPLEEKGGYNLFGFVANRPTLDFDADGRRNPESHTDIDDDVAFWYPPMEGKPCCCRPPGFVIFGSVEDNGSDSTAFRMQLPIPGVGGCWRDLAIRWTTCIRPGGSSGVLASCNNSTWCSFPAGRGTWGIGVYVRYLTCINGKWIFRWHKYTGFCEYRFGVPHGTYRCGP
jgi:RHS repeat-associated protein